MSYKSDAEDYYKEHYAGRGLAPKHVIGLKDAIAKALRKGEKPSNAAKAFFKEKEITLTDKPAVIKEEKSKEKSKEKKREEKTTKKKPKEEDTSEPEDDESEEAAPKKTKSTKLTVVPLPAVEVKNMDRKSLKATIEQLREAGVKIEYSKKDEDDILRRKINDAMQALPSPEMLKMLENIDPGKLKEVLNKDCFGIFIDIRSASCMACPDNEACVKEYLKNLKGDFKMFRPAMQEIKAEESAALVTEDDVKKATKKAKEQKEKAEKKVEEPKAKKVKWDPDRFIAVIDVDIKTLDEEHETYSTLKAVFKEVPTTFAELRAIVEREYDIANDEGFVKDWILGLRMLGYIKLKADLDEDELAAYREAGLLK